MAKWVEFKRDYDHKWKSGAVTAYKEGMILYVKDEILDAAGSAVKEVDKPEGGHPFIPERYQRPKLPSYRPTPPAYDGGPDEASEGDG